MATAIRPKKTGPKKEQRTQTASKSPQYRVDDWQEDALRYVVVQSAKEPGAREVAGREETQGRSDGTKQIRTQPLPPQDLPISDENRFAMLRHPSFHEMQGAIKKKRTLYPVIPPAAQHRVSGKKQMTQPIVTQRHSVVVPSPFGRGQRVATPTQHHRVSGKKQITQPIVTQRNPVVVPSPLYRGQQVATATVIPVPFFTPSIATQQLGDPFFVEHPDYRQALMDIRNLEKKVRTIISRYEAHPNAPAQELFAQIIPDKQSFALLYSVRVFLRKFGDERLLDRFNRFVYQHIQQTGLSAAQTQRIKNRLVKQRDASRHSFRKHILGRKNIYDGPASSTTHFIRDAIQKNVKKKGDAQKERLFHELAQEIFQQRRRIQTSLPATHVLDHAIEEPLFHLLSSETSLPTLKKDIAPQHLVTSFTALLEHLPFTIPQKDAWIGTYTNLMRGHIPDEIRIMKDYRLQHILRQLADLRVRERPNQYLDFIIHRFIDNLLTRRTDQKLLRSIRRYMGSSAQFVSSTASQTINQIQEEYISHCIAHEINGIPEDLSEQEQRILVHLILQKYVPDDGFFEDHRLLHILYLTRHEIDQEWKRTLFDTIYRIEKLSKTTR